jgi:hypothetical protein
MLEYILIFWSGFMAVIFLAELLKYSRAKEKDTKKLLVNAFRIIAYFLIGSAIIILIYVLVMKFVFNVDLVSNVLSI